MATIGSISIAFEANLKGLESGIEDVIDLFDDVQEAVDSLSEKLDGVASKTLTVKTTVDSSGVESARRDVQSLSDDIARAPAEVVVTADATSATTALTRAGVAASTFTDIVSNQAAAGLETYTSAVESTAGAVGAMRDALSTGTAGVESFESSISKAVVVVGRSEQAYNAVGAAVASASMLFRGFGNVTAAAAGSLVSTSVAVASFASAVAGAGAAAVTFGGIMAATRAATAGLSDEAQGFVTQWARIPAAAAASYVGLRAAGATFTAVANAVYDSGTAAEFFQRVFQGVGGATSAAASRASALAGAFGTLLSSITLVSGAAERDISLAQYAALAARVAATSAAFGAAGGAISAFAAGTSVAAGAAGGALSSIAGLAANIPLIGTAAIAAAVATGRFANELEHMSLAAQATDQMADRFGSTTQEMSKLRMAASNTNVSMGQLAKGQQAFYTNLSKVKIGQLNVESVREAKIAYDRLGISVEELKKMSPQDAFKEVAKALSEVEDPAKRTALAFDLFGKQGAAILPALKEFGELEEDFKRVGGALSDIDFERFTTLETSFDRLKASSGSLGTTLMVPFTEMQKAFNNMSADIKGGIVAAFGPLASMIADMTKPFAVVLEVTGRVINIMLRMIGVVTTLVAAFSDFALFADLFNALGVGINYVLSPLESMVSVAEEIAAAIARFLRPAIVGFKTLSDAVGAFTGNILSAAVSMAVFSAAMQSAAVRAVASAAMTYVAWVGVAIGGILASIPILVGALAVMAGSWLASGAAALLAGAQFAVAWLMALGPIGLVILGFAAVAAAFVALYAFGADLYTLFSDIGKAMGLIGDTSVKIDAASASVEELANAASENSKPAMTKDLEALGEQAGLTKEQVREGLEDVRKSLNSIASATGLSAIIGEIKPEDIFGPSVEEIGAAVGAARDEFSGLVIDAARFGKEGADFATAASENFNDLQQKLADGKISVEEFTESATANAESLKKNLDGLKNESAEIALKKNLELFKQLDDAAKEAAKSVRDIGADVRIGDKVFPRSEEVKARAKQYQDEYSQALDGIKRKLQDGGFTRELNARRDQNKADFDAGKITKEQFEKTKVELDTTSAQEQASIAAEGAKRILDMQNSKLQENLQFADNLRKELETAFLSPVELFERELKKVLESDLTPDEKVQAEKMLRKQARENLVGKTATEQLTERGRDLTQGLATGLINDGEFVAQMGKAAEEFADAVGITKTPFEEFASSLNNITMQFGFAGQPIADVREQLKGNAIALAAFDRAVAEARDNLLESIGVEKTPQEVFADQMKKIEEAANAADPAMRITAEERAKAEAAARRQRDSALGAGEDVAGRLAEKRANIAQAFGGGRDNARFAIANNAVDMERRKAAGLDATSSQQLQAGIAKINDAFGVTGKSLAEIQGTLSPQEFAEYQEAIKKNSEAVKASLGVEKSGAEKLAESRKRLDDAVRAGVITEQEKNKAMKEQRDAFLQSLGITQSPAEEFEDAVTKIKENAAELSPEELSKGLRAAKDKLLQSLGVDKSPARAFEDQFKDLAEAFEKGQISIEEFAKGSLKARDSLLQSLGIPLDPVVQLGRRLFDLNEAFSKGLISQEEYTRGQEEARRSMLPGGDEESPVKVFERSMKQVRDAAAAGLISQEDLAAREDNLRAQLQENLKPALDQTTQDRRGVGSADSRSQAGVETFFRILRGRDNPSLKAQLDTAKYTKQIADAAANADAAPVIAQLSAT